MVSRKRQLIGRFSGVGKIFKDEQEITKASYSLDLFETINVARTFTETTEIPGLTDARGGIQVMGEEADLIGDTFVLELTDGRRWDFIATRRDPVSGGYTVVMSGEPL